VAKEFVVKRDQSLVIWKKTPKRQVWQKRHHSSTLFHCPIYEAWRWLNHALGLFLAAGPRQPVNIQGTMDSVIYKEKLKVNLLKSVRALCLGRNFMLKQGKRPPRKVSKSNKAWFARRKITLQWPSQS
jgi:hypothetical protein